MKIFDRFLKSGFLRIPGSSYIPILLILFVRIITWGVFPEPRLAPDSSGYSVDGWLNFELVSLTGSAYRGWPATLFFALFPNDSTRILGQLLLSGFAFGFLIHTATYVLHGRKARWVFSCGVLLIATSPQILQWDTTILGTSLMVSTLVFISALLIRIIMSRRYDVRYLNLLLILLFFLCFQKTSNFLIASMLILLAIFLKWASLTKNSKLKLISIILIFTPLLLLNSNNQESYWKGSYSGTTLLWQLGSQSPSSLALKSFLDLKTQAPDCIFKSAPFEDLNLGIYNALNKCPGGRDYIEQNFKYDFMKFAVTNPDSSLKLITLGMGAVLTSSYGNYGYVVTVFPKFLYSMIWGEVSPDFRFSGDLEQGRVFEDLSQSEPRVLYSPLVLLGLFTLFVAASRKFTKLDRRRSGLLVLILVSSLSQIALAFLLLPSEWFRQSSPYLVLMMIASTFLISKKVFEE